MIYIFGYKGRIGSCISYILGNNNYIGIEVENEFPNLKQNDIVLSCCPFFENFKIAHLAFNNQCHYLDLGGDPETSSKIQELYKNSNLSCITDLGLAPGLVNIWAEHILQSLESPPVHLTLLCGGLPYNNNLPNSLKYAITWSEKGLYNEYMGECDLLQDGKLGTIPTLVLARGIEIDNIRYEAFSTKGGIANSLPRFKELGVKNCGYFTLRYAGHLQYIKFLLEECRLTEEEFTNVIQRVCPKTNEDIVIVAIDADGRQVLLQCQYFDQFSAMQIMTALPTAIVVKMINQGNVINNYQDIENNTFWWELNKLAGDLFPGTISIKNEFSA